MSKKQSLNLRQAGNNTTHITLANVHRSSKTSAQSHPYSGGTISCFLKPHLHWRYKPLSKAIPTQEVQRVDFYINPYVGSRNSCFLKASLSDVDKKCS